MRAVISRKTADAIPGSSEFCPNAGGADGGTAVLKMAVGLPISGKFSTEILSRSVARRSAERMGVRALAGEGAGSRTVTSEAGVVGVIRVNVGWCRSVD